MERITPTIQVAALLLLVSTISGGILGARWYYDIDRHAGLESRIDKYYRLASQNKWGAAYNYFAPEFKKNNSKQLFISKKQSDSSKWKIASFDIGYASTIGDKVKVKIELTGAPHPLKKTAKQSLNAGPQKATKRIAWSIWQKINGSWYAWQTNAHDFKSFTYDVSKK